MRRKCCARGPERTGGTDFSADSPEVIKKLEQLELEPGEDGQVIISRKLQAGKSVCRINGETVTAKQVKELAESLIDIHGQHEHQSLLKKKASGNSGRLLRSGGGTCRVGCAAGV